MRFPVITADPNWAFDDTLPGGRGAHTVYAVSAVEEIMALGPLVQAVAADDAVLLMWAVSSQVQAGLDVMKAWGFEQKQVWVWCKLTVTGKRQFGMGRLARAEKEIVLVGTRGSVTPKVRNERDAFEAHMPTWDRDAVEGADWPAGRYAHLLDQRRGAGPYIHSAKPEAFADKVERMFEGPYLELYARRDRPGWACLGDEAPSCGRDLAVALTELMEA